MREPQIPNFQLYGTPATTKPNLFFNLDLISRVNQQANYRQAAHRHAQLYQLVWLTAGHTTITIDEATYSLGPSTLYLIAPGVVHESISSQHLEGYVLHFSPDFALPPPGNAGPPPWAQLAEASPLPVSLSTTAKRLQGLFESLEAEFSQVSPEKDAFVRYYLLIVLLEMQRLAGLARPAHPDQASSLVPSKFLALVEEHYLTKKQVSDYADLLHITPNYLNALVKHATGRTAGQIIRDRVILEAKRRFLFSEATVAEVAYALNYDDVSYFWRLFKKYVNLSPSEFRKLGYRK